MNIKRELNEIKTEMNLLKNSTCNLTTKFTRNKATNFRFHLKDNYDYNDYNHLVHDLIKVMSFASDGIESKKNNSKIKYRILMQISCALSMQKVTIFGKNYIRG